MKTKVKHFAVTNRVNHLVLILMLSLSAASPVLAQIGTIYGAPSAGNITGLSQQIGHSDSVHSVAFSPDGKTLVSGSADRTIKLWNVASGKELRTLIGHSDSVNSVALQL
jgi:WD40 repeat protein